MTPPNEPPSNPYDPNWPKPETPSPYGSGSEPPTQPYGQQPPPATPSPYPAYGSEQPSDQTAPYGQVPHDQAPQGPYGQSPYGQAPYGQPSPAPYGQVPYGQAAYGAPTYGAPMLPGHPSATTAMVLGICALGGMFFCGLPIVLAPFAWIMGGRAVKQIDANPGRWSGRDQAQAGRIMGMIGSAILVLIALAIAFFVVIAVAADTSYDSSYPSDQSTDSTF